MARCELTFLARTEIDIEQARAQHAGYCRALAALGCEVVTLPAEPELPDSVFVEDTAIVLDDVAIITRPGAASRRAETWAIAQALREHRELVYIQAPGTLDGGDVLRIGRTLCVGSSGRSNRSGVTQLADAVMRFGYRVQTIPFNDCLHLKSAVTAVGAETLLLNPEWVDRSVWHGVELIEVAPDEPFGANALLIGEQVIYPTRLTHTRERLESKGIAVTGVETSELEKAEGAVTCCSLILKRNGHRSTAGPQASSSF